ncbi:OmpA family protein [Flavobacterium agrisoli]|uniref:OmpA family protein n=1 Tax=Flavobacterium agrisoli TaxID=2793066 RepID=A0A934UID5_9FLAO|nr:OmpA family protein [Flavobacterium agrisoli]MBK0368489.1 OmpA family protein [Flavobacterium agrisoli]
MSKKTIYLLGIVVTIILGTFLYLKFCCNCCVEPPIEESKVEVSPTPTVPNFTPFVLIGNDFNYHTNQNLKFLRNDENIIMPVQDSVTIGIVSLKDYLISYPNQRVLITGYATSDENNTTNYENLALARANTIKNFFVSKGLPETQFDTKGIVVETWKMDLDTLLGPAEYKISDVTMETASGNDQWNALKSKINADPLILYFDTNKAKESLTADEKAKFDDIVKYVQNVPSAMIAVVGHTDNVGSSASNEVLAQKRADFAKSYLAKNGIEESKIEATNKGQNEPMADNATPEGQAKNRRAVITIK